MTTYSLTDVATHVARRSGALGAEETLSAADYAYLAELIASQVRMLSAMDIPIWDGSELALPEQYLPAVCDACQPDWQHSIGLISLSDKLALQAVADRNMIVLSNPRGTLPLTLDASDSRMVNRFGGFNFTTGQ